MSKLPEGCFPVYNSKRIGFFGDDAIVKAVFDERGGRWFEFEFTEWHLSMGGPEGLELLLGGPLNTIGISLFTYNEIIEDIRNSSTSYLVKEVSNRIMDGLREKSKLPKGCLAVYESHRIG